MAPALIAATGYVFERMGLSRVEARTARENVRSRRVLEKAGFNEEACLRHRINLHGTRADELVFGVCQDDWIRSASVILDPLHGGRCEVTS